VDKRQARALLDEILEELPLPLRAVFVLYELEEMSVSEMANLLLLPRGTVASRLRRARAEFERVVKRLKARGQIEGEPR
jgi:RNA polymerase sigma-70 factor (ECF subfamily)